MNNEASKMIEKNNVQTLWWMYINNKKNSDPVTIDDTKKYCNQFYQLDFDMFENLLMKGVALRFPEGKIRLRRVRVYTEVTDSKIRNANSVN